MNVLIPTEAEDALIRAAHLATMKLLMEQFGVAWAVELGEPSVQNDVVRKARRAFALPVAQGALLALVEFIWLTAPRWAAQPDLVSHMADNIGVCIQKAVENPPGDFWRHVGEQIRTGEGKAYAPPSHGSEP